MSEAKKYLPSKTAFRIGIIPRWEDNGLPMVHIQKRGEKEGEDLKFEEIEPWLNHRGYSLHA